MCIIIGALFEGTIVYEFGVMIPWDSGLKGKIIGVVRGQMGGKNHSGQTPRALRGQSI